MTESYEDYERVSARAGSAAGIGRKRLPVRMVVSRSLRVLFRLLSLSLSSIAQEYNAFLSRIRSYLAGTRSVETLRECDRLLSEAKKCATAMVGLAEVEGNPLKVREASQRIERDIGPLSKEVQRALSGAGSGGGGGDREELFYQAPSEGGSDMESLISNSESLLRESMAITMETEQIGNSTIMQMGMQREQLSNANTNLERTMEIAQQAGHVLADM